MNDPTAQDEFGDDCVVDPDALIDGEYRAQLLESHPFAIDEQVFISPTISWVYELVVKTVRRRRYGIGFYTIPGEGKTWAIRALKRMLDRKYPGLPVFSTIAQPHTVKDNERFLWVELLKSVGKVGVGNSLEVKTSLIAHLATAAQQSNSKAVLLFVDEAQYWEPELWAFLKGVVNILADPEYGHNVRLIVFSFGQTHLVTIRDKIRTGPDKGKDILNRFFNRLLVLPGVRSAKELEYVLKQLDDFRLNEYPEQSRISYSRFFMPKAFEAGWRLALEDLNLWRALATAKPDLTSVGMGYVVQALRTFFENCAGRDAANFASNRKDWKAAVDECGFGVEDDE